MSKNKKRKKLFIILSIVCLLTISRISFIYYMQSTKIEPIIGAYINGEYSTTLPSKGSGYAVEKIVCDNNKSASWDYVKWGIKLSNWSTRSRCNIYFKSLESFTIASKTFNLDEMRRCPSVNDDGSVNVTEAESQYGYLCKAKDAYGDSYYYRGNVTNNYVLFAGFYWRIVRINGDGTVRVIYDGTSAHTNSDSSTDRQIGTTVFNSSYNDNAYVGYMYGKTGASAYAETHANTNNSTIKIYLDTWYENSIKGTTNERYVADNIFCNDRSINSNPSSGYNNLGYGTNKTAYRWYYVVYSHEMMLACPQKNDAFTVNDTTKGNGALTYSIGLLTADEVVLAGGLGGSSNLNYYLHSGQYYWLASPIDFYGYSASGRYVTSGGGLGGSDVYYSSGARPVLNLSSDVLKNGNGTASDPYHA